MIHLHNPDGSGRTGRNEIRFLYNPSLAFPYLSKNDSDPSLLLSLFLSLSFPATLSSHLIAHFGLMLPACLALPLLLRDVFWYK